MRPQKGHQFACQDLRISVQGRKYIQIEQLRKGIGSGMMAANYMFSLMKNETKNNTLF